MNDTDCAFDDLLYRSLSLFRQFRLYDDPIEGENAFKLLREAEKIINDTRDNICIAKWGCTIECLAHKFYIDGHTDGMLSDVDAFLIKEWKRKKKSFLEKYIVFLWLGEYFLLRVKNDRSRHQSRNKQMVSKILSFLTDILRKSDKQEISNIFSLDVFDETVNWVKEICDMHLFEKQVVALLERLYALQEEKMIPQRESKESSFWRQMWDFYY
ncbi:hypothetical protein [Bacteroides sp. UBA939]|uniref:hypothetical protein n=1 Tax=Bacteroides sp. UBA939 TaxID=1946092 RepID=UPI0025C29E09|nr:hypothetical protein [Bacteroides sp. UBA939]